ncbi:hypothetical protein [Microbacterium sp.]|uniref:hypothetical protein n=1 Tax=Microbacterium sp. TaxID=51671 RepID=UPI0032420755
MPLSSDDLRALMNYQIQREGQPGMTSLAAVIAGFDNAFTNIAKLIDQAATPDEVRQVVFQTPINRQGSTLGGQTNLGVTVAWLDANLASLRPDPDTFAKQILAGLTGQVGDVDEAALRQIVTESVEKAQAEALQKLAQGISQAAS